jgi:N-formylglutamate amidohydrolase
MKSLILHIPHSSLKIPDYSNYLLSKREVDAEAIRMSDLYTDELFQGKSEDFRIKADFCRIFCDVERFEIDDQEPMSKFGMGFSYLKCDDGRDLRNLNSEQKKDILFKYYYKHHHKLEIAVVEQLEVYNEARIIDCHSFPDKPFQCSIYQGTDKFDFNIGTDDYHTPSEWIDIAVKYFKDLGFTLGINEPYAGSIVPLNFYQKNNKVKSIMLEVNRNLYMDNSFKKNSQFSSIQNIIEGFLNLYRF